MKVFILVKKDHHELPQIYTPCPSAPVRYAPVGSPVDKSSEIATPVTNYASPANK